MGGDAGPHAVILAAREILQRCSQLHITLVGDSHVLTPLLQASQPSPDSLSLVHASDTVSMDDKPSVVLRHKQESSMWKALELVRDGQVDACVSSGNTGALMAMGKHLLKTFPGIDRPAICKPLPASNGLCYLLDLGANINCTAEQLLQFAYMGRVLASASAFSAGNSSAGGSNQEGPRIGLLNIGEENIKGIEQVRRAAALLEQAPQLNYCGFVEGDDIYTGDIDVVVCDGFVGNIALKVSEGAAKFLAQTVKRVFTDNWYGRLAGALANPVVNRWRVRYDPARYNGACFLGLRGTVIKSHGAADSHSIYHALQMAVNHVQNDLPEKIHQQFEALFDNKNTDISGR